MPCSSYGAGRKVPRYVKAAGKRAKAERTRKARARARSSSRKRRR